ncbi:retrotrans gag domain-containing protein [Citrus sinensis]|nr:retrotrans gag domain-containing protein [Citrus sinensis]
MATNKERIELLEDGLGSLQDGMNRMELGINDRLHHLAETLNKLTETIMASRGASIQIMAKLEFPRYSDDNPTEWFNRVNQFFEFQGINNEQKVSLASFHLEGEANQWWQWLRRSYKEEGKEVTWEIFHDELWPRFGPTDCEDFDEALLKVEQVGSLRDYQKEFERLGNQVQGWTQKALVETFMGGLKPELDEDIRIVEQLMRQRETTRPFNRTVVDFSSSTKFTLALIVRRNSHLVIGVRVHNYYSWRDEMGI